MRVISGLEQHGISSVETAIKDQPGHFTQINIGKDCWIGEGAIIAADIGDHSVVAAGSVVVKAVAPYSIVAGNPAKVIRMRNETEVDSPLLSDQAEIESHLV